MENKFDMTRRGFLQGSAIMGTAALGLGALAGCSPSSKAAPAEELSQTGSEVQEEGDIENIAPVEVPAEWTQECDVVVVGAGGAGLIAALKAADNGAKVILVEKGNAIGGAARFSTAAGAYGSYVQKEKSGFDLSDKKTHDEFYNLLWERQNYTINGSVMESIMQNSGQAIDWMHDKFGIGWETREPDPYNIEFRYHTPEGKMPLRHIGVMGFVTDELYNQGQKLGVDYQTQTEMTALVKDGAAIVGIQATQGGDTIHIKANSVILCGGGMANNRAMLQKYVPMALEACGASYDMCGTGDVIRMGWGAGADMSGYNSFDAFDGGITYYERGLGNWYHFLYDGDIALARQPWLFVNNQCNRFAKMETAQLFFRPRVIGSQPDHKAYVIFDSRYPETIWDFGERGCRQPVTPEDPDIDNYASVLDSTNWLDTVQKAIEAGGIVEADTIEELGEKLGLDSAKLAETVSRYNGYCEKGADPEFGTPAELLVSVTQAPFYGIEVKGLLASTDCGLRVNGNYEVLDEAGNPIPGLYAAGHTAGASAGEMTFGHATFTSNMGYVYASGYAAAKSATGEPTITL